MAVAATAEVEVEVVMESLSAAAVLEPPPLERRYSINTMTQTYRAPELVVASFLGDTLVDGRPQPEVSQPPPPPPPPPSQPSLPQPPHRPQLPPQLPFELPIGPPADVWSAGCVFAELLERHRLAARLVARRREVSPLDQSDRCAEQQTASEPGSSGDHGASTALVSGSTFGRSFFRTSIGQSLEVQPADELDAIIRTAGLPASALAKWRAWSLRSPPPPERAPPAQQLPSAQPLQPLAPHLLTAESALEDCLSRLKPQPSKLPHAFAELDQPLAIDLLQQLLAVDADERARSGQALRHPFFAAHLPPEELEGAATAVPLLADESWRAIASFGNPRGVKELVRVIKREAVAAAAQARQALT